MTNNSNTSPDAVISNMYMALGDVQRQKIMVVLSTKNEINVGTLAQQFHLTRSAVTHHIKIMKNANILNRKKIGKEVYYSINTDTIKFLMSKMEAYISK